MECLNREIGTAFFASQSYTGFAEELPEDGL